MASKPPSTASSTKSRWSSVNDHQWKQLLIENREELVNGLKKVAMTVLKSLHENNVIEDKQFWALRSLKPINITEKILDAIEKKDKQEFLIFRDILKKNRQLALYKLLDPDNVVDSKMDKVKQEGDELGDLRQQVGESNKKMDQVLNVLLRFETKQDIVMEEMKQKQQECENLKKTNSGLNSQIQQLAKKLKQCRCGGSGETVKKLEREMKSKTENLENNEKAKERLEKEVKRLKDEIHEMNAASSSDETISKR